jgi:ABC-type Zn uptake system ZnuABC Zn-binding protein ZnuA
MSKKLVLLMMAVFALSLFAVACGDEETANDAAPQAEQTAEGETGQDVPDNAKEAVERCKQSFQNQPQLSDDVKADLEAICEKAASGDEQAVKEATRDVCVKIVEETVPEGNPARDQAIETCKTSTQ